MEAVQTGLADALAMGIQKGMVKAMALKLVTEWHCTEILALTKNCPPP